MKHLTYAFAVILLCGCSSKTNPQNKQQAGPDIPGNVAPVVDADNNELPHNAKSIEDVTFSVHKLSPDDVKAIFSKRFSGQSDYSDFSCFVMDINSDTYPDILDYPSLLFTDRNQKMQYLSFSIKDDLSVEAGNSVYQCINVSYEPSRGQLPYARFFLVFNKIKEDKATLRFNDNYFNKGIINLSF